MKIGIFGDSFATSVSLVSKQSGISWTRLLKNYGYQTRNFAEAASSLWWSYERFLKNYEKCDQIIFVVTSLGRVSSPKKIILSKYWHIAGMSNLEDNLKKYKSNFELKILNSMKDYFLYFQNDQQEKFLHNKIIEEIINKCNSDKKPLLLIPAYQDSVDFQNIFKMPLVYITNKELRIDTGSDSYVLEKSTRANHMSKHNNEILAKLVHEILQGMRTSVTMDDFIFKKSPNPEDYWEI